MELLATALLSFSSGFLPSAPPSPGAWLCCAAERACGPGTCYKAPCPADFRCVRDASRDKLLGFVSLEACTADCGPDVSFPGDRLRLPARKRCANGLPAVRLSRSDAVCGPLPTGTRCATGDDCSSGLCAQSWFWEELRCT